MPAFLCSVAAHMTWHANRGTGFFGGEQSGLMCIIPFVIVLLAGSSSTVISSNLVWNVSADLPVSCVVYCCTSSRQGLS